MRILMGAIVIIAAVSSVATPAKVARRTPVPTAKHAPARAPASASGLAGTDDGEKALKVQGQSRNLNMMLMLRGEKERVEFGETRKDYRQEVMGTQY